MLSNLRNGVSELRYNQSFEILLFPMGLLFYLPGLDGGLDIMFWNERTKECRGD